jgi:hypothetical protein
MRRSSYEERQEHIFALEILARGAAQRGRTGFYGFIVVSIR